jgi:hypothetical protein
VQAVGQREIDDAILASEWYRRLGAFFGEWLQTAAAATSQYDAKGFILDIFYHYRLIRYNSTQGAIL